MGKFDGLSQDVNAFLMKMLENQKLCKLLNFNTSSPLEQDDIDDTSTLLFNKIYPFPFTPEVESEATSVVSILLDNFALVPNSDKFATNEITFVILCHQSLWKIDGGQLRPYLIMQEIDNMFNNERGFGLGKLKFSTGKVAWANLKYVGYRITYKITDFD